MSLNVWSCKATVILLMIISSMTANSSGSYLWYPPQSNEANVYARVIELQHAGDRNGRLLATWEHWYTQSKDNDQPNGDQGSFIIRESEDGGNSWSTVTTINDPQSGSGHPCTRFWQPFLFEFPRSLGQYPEGTLLLVGNLVASDSSFTSFFLWRSLDHGNSWIPGGEWRRGGYPNGIWEPAIFLDSADRLVAIFSDEQQGQWSQVLMSLTSDDGGDSWDGDAEFVVRSQNPQDRPGMGTVARMDNGEYILSYEYCGQAHCHVYVKRSSNGWDWDPDNMGDAVLTTDGLYPGMTPYIVWDPTTKRVILSSSAVYKADRNDEASQSHQILFTNSQYGQGQWRWSPAPWDVPARSKTCNSNYSPDLLVRSNGKIRLTAPSSEGDELKCSERTGEAFLDVIPYHSDFATDGASGWLKKCGDWSVSGNEYEFALDSQLLSITLTGSTGWTNYTVTSDMMVTKDPGQIGLMVHVSASSSPRVSFVQGFMFALNTGTNKLVVTRQGPGHNSTELHSAQAPWPVEVNKWYRLSLSSRPGGSLVITATQILGDQKNETSHAYEKVIEVHGSSSTDNNLGSGMAGLFGLNCTGKFKNVHITEN